MQIVINLEDEIYEDIKYRYDKNQLTLGAMVLELAILHGEILPKGHGRLIDADKLDTRERGNNSQRTMWWNIDCIVKHAPTIVEADMESDNG